MPGVTRRPLRAAWAAVAIGMSGPAVAVETGAAPTVRIYGGETRDTDDVVQRQRGIELDVDALSSGAVRVGVVAERIQLSDPGAAGSADAWALRARLRLSPTLQLDGRAGSVRMTPGVAGRSSVDRAQAGAKLRWRAPTGSKGELRLTLSPLLASPALLAQPVQLTEARAMFTAPLLGPLLGRVRAQHGVLDESRQTNRRSGFELGTLVQIAPSVELGVNYGEVGYRRKALSAYSAPRRLRVAELAIYGEWDAWGPVALVLDAGIGRQQVSRHDEAQRAWTKSLRAIAQVTWRLAPAANLGLEYERNDSPLGGIGQVPGAMWRSDSLALFLRLGLAP